MSAILVGVQATERKERQKEHKGTSDTMCFFPERVRIFSRSFGILSLAFPFTQFSQPSHNSEYTIDFRRDALNKLNIKTHLHEEIEFRYFFSVLSFLSSHLTNKQCLLEFMYIYICNNNNNRNNNNNHS